MQLDPRFKPPSPPRVSWHDLPDEEREIGRSIYSNLSSLSSETNNIAAAIALFTVCRDNDCRDLFDLWIGVAARDGAMSIRNFGESLASVRSLIGRVKSWLPLIDTQALKSAEALFNEKFPFAHKMRHSVAHPEFYNDPSKKMGMTGDINDVGVVAIGVENLVIKGMISNYTFASTFEGTLVKYDVTGDTLVIILKIINQVFDGFSHADGHGNRTFPPRSQD